MCPLYCNNWTGSFAACLWGPLSRWVLCTATEIHPTGSDAEHADRWPGPGVKKPSLPVRGAHGGMAVSVSCRDWLCYLFKLCFPRRLLEDYFVVLIDTFKLSIAIILTLFFYPVITFSIRIILISFCEKM